jgi:hypothetical protein
MSVKQVFAVTLGGIVAAVVGGFLVAPVMLLVHADDGGGGWVLLWILLMILSGIVGAAFSARWCAAHRLGVQRGKRPSPEQSRSW